MEGNKICIERELHSKSANIIWSLISTPAGLAKWMADEVTLDENIFTFTWGNVWSHHETRTAAVIDKKPLDHIRLRWNEDEFRDTYFELRISKSEITDDYILIITDYAIDGDTETLRDIWDANMEKLHRSTGI